MENKPICIIDEYGTKRWWVDSRLHREDGPAIENPDGHKQWWVDGKCHRVDGPAIIYSDGSCAWVINGKSHRLDGPAIVNTNNKHYWFINDYNVTDIITQWAEENNIDLYNLAEVDKALIKLIWADYKEKT